MTKRFRKFVVGVGRAGALLLLVTCTDNRGPTVPSSIPDVPPDVVSGPLPAPPSAFAVQLIGAGDIARCDRANDEATARLLDGYPNATVFALGDNVNGNGSLTDFTSCYQPSWGRHKARTRPAVGEKEYKTANAAGFNQYFGAAGGALGNYYYSYDLGAWHIMVLNDQISMVVGSPQELWLRNELATNTRKCTLAYWHRPRFSSAGGNNLAAVKPLWDALYAYSADVVLNAHDDVYERFAPQSPTAVADPAKGLRQFTVGTGGLNTDNIGSPRPNSQARAGGVYGVLLLTLDTLDYSWQFIPIAGQTFTDAGSSACHTRIAVASVDVSPPSASVVVGGTVQLTATPKDAAGTPLSGRVVTWQTSNATIATVSASGLVTAMGPGPVTITATSEGKNGTSAVTVDAGPVASVDVTPATPSVQVNATVQLTATTRDANGNVLSGRPVTWTTSDATIATVDANGLVTGQAVGGPVTITATSEGKSGTSSVTVSTTTVASVASVDMSPPSATIPVNGTRQITATPKDASGNVLSGRSVTWASSAPAIATVNSTGFVVGLQTGTANITATSEGIVGTSTIDVQPASGPPVIVGAGDIADCSRLSQEGTARLLDTIPGTVVVLGDNAYLSGTFAEYMNCYDPSWGRHKARTRPSAGNHEYNSGSAAGAPGYYQYFGAAAGDPTKGWYSYDLGAWHLVVLNSNLDMSVGSAQEQWLRADLAAHPTTCTLAYWHHPRFSSGGNGSTPSTQPLFQALYDYGAELVLNGHDHNYERFAPQTATGVRDDARGIREIVAGAGGNSLYSWPGNPIANSEIRSNASYGVIKVTLWPTSYDWDFIPVAGGTFSDHGSSLCHSGTPLANQAPVANTGGPYFSEGAVTLDGRQSRDPDNNTPLTYAWTLGDGTTATTATVTHTYPAEGQYTITLRVTDAKGATSAAAGSTVTIGNIAPTVNAGADQAVIGTAPLNLSARFTDPGATDNPWFYTITWGDGATSSGSTNSQANPITDSHAYPAPGQYTARVTVTDKDGGSGFDELLVKVLDPGTVQVFSGAGNIASCGTDVDELTAQSLDTLPGRVFVLGDNVNPSGSAANYTNCYNPTWGRHKARTNPTIGNHEYDVTGANGYFGYFGAAAGDPTKGYYSFDLGDWHVVVLNNTASVASGTGSVQEQWLKADLAASTKRCTIAMFHYPLFFSSDDPSWHSASGVLGIWNDLYQAGAEIVLNGQQYDYERFALQDPGGNADPRGIREFNVGTGGYATAMPTSIAPNTEAVSDAYGILKLSLGPDTYTWKFIPSGGSTFTDSGSGSCH